ncbi:MAG: hypothetical protein Q4F88_02065 [Eubacteriales bacterium]|nr:hypothetical protein [Eubacteriales bacterium]
MKKKIKKRLLSIFLILSMLCGNILINVYPAYATNAKNENLNEYGISNEELKNALSNKDDSSYEGQILASLRQMGEASENDDYGNSNPTDDWGEDLEDYDWYIPNVMYYDFDNYEQVNFQELGGDDLNDASGSGNEDQGEGDDSLGGGILNFNWNTVLNSLGGNIEKKVFDWAAGKLLSKLFGSKSTDDRLDEINAKLDQIIKAIQEIMKEIKNANLREDVAKAAGIRNDIDASNKVTRQALDLAGKDAKTVKSILSDYHTKQVGGSSIYEKIMSYGTTLAGFANRSNQNIFKTNYDISKNMHFPWASQESRCNITYNDFFMSAYVEAVGYAKLSLKYQMEVNANDKEKLVKIMAIYMTLIGDNSSSNSNLKSINAAYKNAPKFVFNEDYDTLRYGKNDENCIQILRSKLISEANDTYFPIKPDAKTVLKNITNPKAILNIYYPSLSYLKNVQSLLNKNGFQSGPASKGNLNHIREVLKIDRKQFYEVLKRNTSIDIPEDDLRWYCHWDDLYTYKDTNSGSDVYIIRARQTYRYDKDKNSDFWGILFTISVISQGKSTPKVEAYCPKNESYSLFIIYDGKTNLKSEMETRENGKAKGKIVAINDNELVIYPDTGNDDAFANEIVTGAEGAIRVTYYNDVCEIKGASNNELKVGDEIEFGYYDFNHLLIDFGEESEEGNNDEEVLSNNDEDYEVNLLQGENWYTTNIEVKGNVSNSAQGIIKEINDDMITIEKSDDNEDFIFQIGMETEMNIPDGRELKQGDEIEVVYRDGGWLLTDLENAQNVALSITLLSTSSNEQYVFGTIESVSEEILELLSSNGENMTFAIDQATDIINIDGTKELSKGDQIEVLYEEPSNDVIGGQLHALTINVVQSYIEPVVNPEDPSIEPIVDPVLDKSDVVEKVIE